MDEFERQIIEMNDPDTFASYPASRPGTPLSYGLNCPHCDDEFWVLQQREVDAAPWYNVRDNRVVKNFRGHIFCSDDCEAEYKAERKARKHG